MSGLQYGGRLGGQYNGPLGGQYGPSYHGRRLDLTPPGASSPDRRLEAIISVEITPEHTALSEMTVEIPPFDGIINEYDGGEMAYHVDGRLLFAVEIDSLAVADDNTITLSGTAVEDAPLDHDEYDIAYEEIATADAIEDFLTRLPYESVVHPEPPRPINGLLAQTASEAGDFEAMLEAGSEVEDDSFELARDIPDAIMQFGPDEYIPSLHPTTPIQVRPEGLTTTQTTIFAEVEDYIGSAAVVSDTAASGGQAGLIDAPGEWFGINFAFVHDIPKGKFDIAYRARIGSLGPDAYDRIEFRLDGQTLVAQDTARVISYSGGYRWYVANVTYDETLDSRDVAAGDDPHRLEIEKIEGDDDIYFDCIAFRDRRFGFGTSLTEAVDSNGALEGPQIYPNFMPIVFDAPAIGADIDHVSWKVNYDKPAQSGVPGLAIPKTDVGLNGGDWYNSDDVILGIDHDIPDDVGAVTTVYGVAFIDNYSDPNRSVSPKTNTERQVLEGCEMIIDGTEHSIIDDAKEYSGTALSILQDLHTHANRHFVVEHGVEAGQQPRFDSFVKGDQSLVAGESDDWIITSKNREVTDNGDANVVRVTGARAPNGTYYQGVAADLPAVFERGIESPESGEDIELVELRDKSLTSDNDCLSRARTELHDRSRVSVGGDLDIAPELMQPGYPYRIQAFDAEDITAEEVGYGLNYGKYYGVGSLGVTSSLETITFSESADGASTSLSFERPHALLQTIESIVDTPDERPTPVRDNPPIVSSDDSYPNPPEDGGNQPPDNGGGGEIAYLDSSNPLADAAYELGGSAGPGTHGGTNVSRPANMPTKAEADFIVRNASQLRFALDTGPGYVIYIDADIDISSFNGVTIPRDTKLVGGFCDPARTENGGRGPILYNHDSRPYNRRHLIARNPVEVWGVSFEGPRGQFDTLDEKYFDPNDYPGPNSDFYVSALWCYPDPQDGETLIYGSEFRGWNVAGLETGERTTESTVRVERSTFRNNCMETLGYGIEQWNGHLECDLCYFDFNRHAISGFGYSTESWIVKNSMHGPNAISHAFDMHGLRQNDPDFNGNLAGKFIRMENVTIPFTEEHIRNPGSGQEGMRLRGASDQVSEVNNCHFYHTQPPDPPGEQGDPFYQTFPGQPSNSFVRLTASGNNYGERLEQGAGCPLNAPIKPPQ